jgi:uncharacterized protein (DUF433 family)
MSKGFKSQPQNVVIYVWRNTMVAVLNSLIELDEHGVPWITGANTKVVEVVLDKMAYGWSPEEMHREHPHLSMAQIHAALAYYYEHQDEVDADIERRDRYVEEMRAQQKNPFTREELLRRREAQEKRQ